MPTFAFEGAEGKNESGAAEWVQSIARKCTLPRTRHSMWARVRKLSTFVRRHNRINGEWCDRISSGTVCAAMNDFAEASSNCDRLTDTGTSTDLRVRKFQKRTICRDWLATASVHSWKSTLLWGCKAYLSAYQEITHIFRDIDIRVRFDLVGIPALARDWPDTQVWRGPVPVLGTRCWPL